MTEIPNMEREVKDWDNKKTPLSLFHYNKPESHSFVLDLFNRPEPSKQSFLFRFNAIPALAKLY